VLFSFEFLHSIPLPNSSFALALRARFSSAAFCSRHTFVRRLAAFLAPFICRSASVAFLASSCRCRVISAWRVACPIPDVASAMHALSPARHIRDTAGCACLLWAHSASLSCHSVWRALSLRPLTCHAKAGRVPGLFTDGAYRPCGVDAGAILGRSHSPHSPAKLRDSRHSQAPLVHLPHWGIRARSDKVSFMGASRRSGLARRRLRW
jgi:hypothetical protein